MPSFIFDDKSGSKGTSNSGIALTESFQSKRNRDNRIGYFFNCCGQAKDRKIQRGDGEQSISYDNR